MAARHRSFALRGKQVAVRVAEETNNYKAVRRFSVLIANNIRGRLITVQNRLSHHFLPRDACRLN